MSLTVSPALLDDARTGEVADADFAECIRTSLPYAYDLVSQLAADLTTGERVFVDDVVPPPDEAARGQLLRAMSSDAIRTALVRHFGVTLAFQNCHRVAVFAPDARGTREHTDFTSVRSQLLNQSPELVNC